MPDLLLLAFPCLFLLFLKLAGPIKSFLFLEPKLPEAGAKHLCPAYQQSPGWQAVYNISRGISEDSDRRDERSPLYSLDDRHASGRIVKTPSQADLRIGENGFSRKARSEGLLHLDRAIGRPH